ncbi:MAG: ATP-binding protein [Chlamydiae bacterium]|nr:ATP-binding protein [Chlamydiota bacterium]
MSIQPSNQPSGFLRIMQSSLPEYIGVVDQKCEAGQNLIARIMALALPLFELKAVVFNGMACVIRLPGMVLHIVWSSTLIFLDTQSLAFKLLSLALRLTPTPIQVLKLAAKTVICAFGIFLAPLIGIIAPKFNVKCHKICGLASAVGRDIAALGGDIADKSQERGFDAVVGMDDVKKQMQAVMNTVLEPGLNKVYRLNPTNGIIFHGSPGNGKTYFVERFIEQLEIVTKKKVAVHRIDSNVISKYHGGTSANITETFKEAAADAQTNKSLSVIFIDEIDTIIPSSAIEGDSAPGQAYATERGAFLRELTEASKNNVLVIGATNHPERLDEAIVRPGRIDTKICIPNPDAAARLSLLNHFFDKVPQEEGLSFENLVQKTEGWSVSDIKLFAEQVRIEARDKTIERSNHRPPEKVKISQAMINQVFEKSASQREKYKQEYTAKSKKEAKTTRLLEQLFTTGSSAQEQRAT